MTIINGTVEFTTPRPFEAKSARVSLSFTVEAGADAELTTFEVGQMARRQAYSMIAELTMTTAEPAAKEPAPRRRAPPPSTEISGGPFGDPLPPAVTPPVAPPAAAISNDHLQHAILEKNADVRNTDAIKALIIEFTGDPLKKIYTVEDQAKRAEFLGKLAAL
jgi:hypothetical protein